MKDFKRILSSVLVFCLLFSLAPAAFAAEDVNSMQIINDGEVTLGEVDVERDMVAIGASSLEGKSTVVTVEGSVSDVAELAVYAVQASSDYEGSSTTVNVAGDVYAEALPCDSENDPISLAVDVSAFSGGSTSVSVGGSAELVLPEGFNGTVVSASTVSEAGTAEVTVGGDVTSVSSGSVVTGVLANSAADYWDYDSDAQDYVQVDLNDTEAVSTVSVGGDVTVKSVNAIGVQASAEDGGTSAVTVGGKVQAEGLSGMAVDVNAYNGGNSSAAVDGDVSLTIGSGTDDRSSIGVDVHSALSGSAEATVGGSVTVKGDECADVSGVEAHSTGIMTQWDPDTQEMLERKPEPGDPAASSRISVEGDVAASALDHANGISIEAFDGGTVVISVGGSVSAEAASSDAVNALVVEGSSLDLDIGGNISASADNGTGNALLLSTYSDSSSDVRVDGDISASGFSTAAVRAFLGGDSEVEAIINGDIRAEGKRYVDGIQTSIGDGSSLVLVLDGSIDVKASDADGSALGMSVSAYDDASVDITMAGDINSSGTALNVFIATPSDINASSKVEITVDGTISGKESSIMVNGDSDPDALKLTVWKVELDKDGHAVTPETVVRDQVPAAVTDEEIAERNADYAAVAEKAEQNILYIIKLEQPKAGGTIRLSGTTKDGDYDVAKEGDSVYLLVTVAEGYQLDGAYNGDGEKVALKLGDDGNYYLVVPKGGGVYLTADLSEITLPEQPAAVYTVPAKPAKKAIAKAAAESAAEGAEEDTTADEPVIVSVVDENNEPVNVKVDVAFYDDNTFDVQMSFEDGSKTRIEGSFKFVNGALTLVLKDGTEITADADGFLLIPLANGTVLRLRIDQSMLDTLKKNAG